MSDNKYLLVEEDYDNVEESFHNAYDATTEFHTQITSFAYNFKTNDRLLNIGGTLAECLYFLEKGIKVTDLDISKTMLDYISDREQRIETIKANIKDFNGSKYKGIWACRSLIHIPPEDIGLVLGSIKSLLDRNGIIGAVFFVSESKDIVIDEMPEPHTNKPDTTYYCVKYPPNLISDEFIKAGFKLKKVEDCTDQDGDRAIYIEALQ